MKTHWHNLSDENLAWCDDAAALGFELRFWRINGLAGASVNLGEKMRVDSRGTVQKKYLSGYASSSEETLDEAVSKLRDASKNALEEVRRLSAKCGALASHTNND